MSDFLSRLAARAVGDSPRAQPRLPALFEDRAETDAALEIVDHEIVAPVRPPLAREEAAAPRADAAVGPAPPLEVPGARTETDNACRDAAWAPQRPHDAAGPSVPHTHAAPEDAVASPRAGAAPAAAPAPAAPLPPAAVAAPAVAEVRSPLASVVPVVAGPRETAAPSPTPAAREDQPTVRVHIGRLEVRANLQQPAREQPRRASPPAEGVSLADYLRGRRETA